VPEIAREEAKPTTAPLTGPKRRAAARVRTAEKTYPDEIPNRLYPLSEYEISRI
jgi:hypothetical protein